MDALQACAPRPLAIVLGASGSVGSALVDALVRSGRFARVAVLTRRPLDNRSDDAMVSPCIVADMRPEALTQAVVRTLAEAPEVEAIGFSVLGVGAGTAKLSLDEHRAVAVALNAAFARGLRASGKVRHLLYMSAVGANPSASTRGSGAAGMPRYARVKGEAEAAVRAEGPPRVSIFRPSVILGSRHTPAWIGRMATWFARWTPEALRPIETRQIAQAMVAAAFDEAASTPGSAVHTWAGMKALIDGFRANAGAARV